MPNRGQDSAIWQRKLAAPSFKPAWSERLRSRVRMRRRTRHSGLGSTPRRCDDAGTAAHQLLCCSTQTKAGQRNAGHRPSGRTASRPAPTKRGDAAVTTRRAGHAAARHRFGAGTRAHQWLCASDTDCSATQLPTLLGRWLRNVHLGPGFGAEVRAHGASMRLQRRGSRTSSPSYRKHLGGRFRRTCGDPLV